MKKSKLSIGLVTSFIATMALSACDAAAVTSNKENLVNFTGYGDEELSIRIDDMYDDYMKSSSGISKYYDSVMEVLIRHAFQKDKDGNDPNGLKGVKKNYNAIVKEAKDNVRGSKETASQNAETNGTDYKTEWQAILSEKGVKDEEELLQYYIYQLEKSEIEDWYYEQHKDELRREYLGLWSSSKDGASAAGTSAKSTKANSRYPYHVRHILVKVEDGANEYTRGSVSADQAKLLSETVELLAKGTMTFGEVAQKKSEDSSASSYGDVGLMTNAISGGKLGMVNEFQLGIYAYDAVKKNTGVSDEIDSALGLGTSMPGYTAHRADDESVHIAGETAKEYMAARGIVEIPYSVFKELGDVASLENNEATGLPVEDGKSAIYPRNLLWNRYLNNHSIFVITNGARPENAKITEAGTRDSLDAKTSASYYAGEDDYIKYDKTAKEINYANLAGFKANTGFAGTNEKVLCDEKGNVIIGVRSQFGIHLMIVEKSIYDFNSAVKLEDYYTTAIPSDNDYPEIPDGEHTYVDFIYSENKSEYNSRAETVKSAIKGFDSTYDYRLYEVLSARDDVNKEDAKTKKLFDLIDGYIELQREKNKADQDEGIQEVWKTYFELLETQDFYRHGLDRVVSEGCKIAFTKDIHDLTDAEIQAITGVAVTESNRAELKKACEDAYKEGGKCYVK